MLDGCIYAGARTPFGRHGGVLAAVRPDDLAAGVIAAALARTPFAAETVEEVILGCACQSGEDARNIARHAALLAGLPVEVAGVTVNRLCGSGLSAAVDAARAVTLGEADIVVAGGVESMTRAPFVMGKSASPFARSMEVYDSTIGARFPNPRFMAAWGNDTMPETADNIAREMAITRDESDRIAAASQDRAARAQAAGIFAEEIAPVEVTGRRGATRVDEDEHPRPETTLDSLAAMRPLTGGGVVTAGNASGINDGAAALVIGARALGDRSGIAPLATIRAAAVAGVAPRVMGLGPAPASAKALARAGLTLADMDLIEVNEAFAVQVLGACRLMGLDPWDTRLNPNGGAIALGHPLGATGARLLLTAALELNRRGGRYALVTMCIGVGQGIAAVIERG
ncbi:acetyl-CoA C-acyltransferase [Rhodovulum euryhalinum]|uniref:Acetyl-CoA C-acetyltransferase n=1 Tax=Rhodovulum euryhalinum TaxID=35805 RepID=A0A4R2KHY6_9RHOB|nr:acetyl-CoA C-acyltransferase [Rhodovulum euryhalinum]TCO70126.1 acetyl-CoA C-acetyltransferase [Rhodovulum euryhalinum]